jgi:hypothetical protein
MEYMVGHHIRSGCHVDLRSYRIDDTASHCCKFFSYLSWILIKFEYRIGLQVIVPFEVQHMFARAWNEQVVTDKHTPEGEIFA